MQGLSEPKRPFFVRVLEAVAAGRIVTAARAYLIENLEVLGRPPEADDFLLYPENGLPIGASIGPIRRRRWPRTPCTAGGTGSSGRRG
jgi:hypothetical protein